MNLTSAIQEALVALLCYDSSKRGSKFVRALVPVKFYDVYYRDLAQAAIEYIDKYGDVPGEHTLDLIETLKSRLPDKAEIFTQIFQSLEQTKNNINRDYVIAEATTFCRFQGLKTGIIQALEFLQRETKSSTEEAEKVLLDSIKQSTDLFWPGINLFDPQQSLKFLDLEFQAFPTGISEIDRKSLGPGRKRLHVFTARPGRGKSWWLVNLAKQALLHRLRVVYVTLELSEDEVSQRCIQALFSVGKRDQLHTHLTFERDEWGKFLSMDNMELANRPFLKDRNIRGFLRNKLEKVSARPPLIIREFPTGSLTVRELEGYLDGLEASINYIPDLLLIDYADLMSLGTRNYRLDLGALYKDLRGIAMKRNIAVATACQANREGGKSLVITERHMAEDDSKAGTADCVLTYNQTQDEHSLGLARLFQAKGRTDVDKFTVLISQAYGLGQFVMDSVKMTSSYWGELKSILPDKKEKED